MSAAINNALSPIQLMIKALFHEQSPLLMQSSCPLNGAGTSVRIPSFGYSKVYRSLLWHRQFRI
jgi:hypothetical protein